jgi:hypothetical protein
MVNHNAKELYGKKAIEFVKQYLDKNLPWAEFESEYNDPSGYWGVKYFYQGAYFSLDSDRGGLECNIIIDNKKFPLWQFDRKVVPATKSNDKCIITNLDTVIKFFEVKQ